MMAFVIQNSKYYLIKKEQNDAGYIFVFSVISIARNNLAEGLTFYKEYKAIVLHNVNKLENQITGCISIDFSCG